MKKALTLEDGIRVIAGSAIVASVLLGLLVNKWWFMLSLFVGLNLIQSAFSGFCLAEKILKKIGLKKEKD